MTHSVKVFPTPAKDFSETGLSLMGKEIDEGRSHSVLGTLFEADPQIVLDSMEEPAITNQLKEMSDSKP